MANIMVVDDAAFVRLMLKDILIKDGHDIVCEGADGQEAVERYKAYRPELVLMDITMPVMEGVDAAKEILKHDPEARIIMCSAMGQKQMIIQAIQAGALDFIVKPFHGDRVLDAVRRALSRIG